MRDIKVLLTEIVDGGDAGSQKDYHGSHPSSVKGGHIYSNFSTSFFPATIFIPMQSTRSWHSFNCIAMISHIYLRIFTLCIPSGS